MVMAAPGLLSRAALPDRSCSLPQAQRSGCLSTQIDRTQSFLNRQEVKGQYRNEPLPTTFAILP